jgi:4-amino-4-deoxy-L-arabinose transferase-like glycosyltransferase
MLAWSLVGFGFLTKMLQALLVLPAFALVYLIAAPTGLARRIRQLTMAGVVFLVSAGWWVAIVELWPKSSRPYIGGSQHNSVLELIFGYNGFGRLTGNENGSVGGGGQGTGQWGPTGLLRMFNTEFGGQISWLLPAALMLLFAGLVYRWRAPRTDRTRRSSCGWMAR